MCFSCLFGTAKIRCFVWDKPPELAFREKNHNFGYLKVNGRNKMKQKMNMFSDLTDKQVRDKILLVPIFLHCCTFHLKMLSPIKGSSDLREGQF